MQHSRTRSYSARLVCAAAVLLIVACSQGSPTKPERIALGISTQPQNQTVAYGATATLTVGATGTPPLTYQWHVGDSGTTTKPADNGATASYTTPAMTATTSYWVRVSDAAGSMSSSTATITVTPADPPAITKQPEDLTIAAGDKATLTVEAAGSPPLSYQWDEWSHDILHAIDGATAATFVTKAQTDTVVYVVRVTNPRSSVDSNRVTVSIASSAVADARAAAESAAGAHTDAAVGDANAAAEHARATAGPAPTPRPRRRRLRHRRWSCSRTRSAAGSCIRHRTGGIRTSAARRWIRTRRRSSTSSARRDRCIRTSGRRRTAFRTSASAARRRACRSRSSPTAARATRDTPAFPAIPMPEEAKTQANYIEGGVPGGGGSGDRHMLIVDRDRFVLYELFATRWNAGAGRWEAGSGAIFDLNRNDRRPEGWTSADAAGLAILPGLVRYDDVSCGEISHAFRVTVRSTNGYVWPASHSAGSTGGALPMGARLRLKASKDISGFPPDVQRIFRAMKTYGLIVADNGSDMYITGTMDARWNNGVLNPAFGALKASDFEVVMLGWR